MESGGLQVAVGGFVSGGLAPHRLRHEPRDPIKHDAQDALVRAGGRQVQADLGFHLDHPRGDIEEARRSRSVSHWATAKLERFGIAARRPHMSQVGDGMQEEPELVGRRSCAGGAVGGEMHFPRLDVVLGRLAGRRTAPTKPPSPSNTTIGWKPYSS